MTTISVPIPAHMEEFIGNQIKSGKAANKADVFRKALLLLAEKQAIDEVLEARRELGEGKYLKGDLKQLAKKFRNA